MKRFLIFFALLPFFCLCASASHGVWVSTVFHLDYPSAAGLSDKQLREEADAIIGSCVEYGLDTIYLQVRPSADAIYPSEIFPYSAYLSGKQGEGSFDALAYFLNAAHEHNLSLHAWINPYRVTATASSSKEKALLSLSEDNPARKHPEYTIFADDDLLYFNPGLPEVRQLVLSGIAELLDRYAVDGIHFDDYFYPTCGFDDSAAFEKYGGDSVGDFRRESVDLLIESACRLCREKGVLFGVSPAGIWGNAAILDGGSDTLGSQSYFTGYADSLKWVKNEWVDYISPQLYWSIGNSKGEFETLVKWWSNAVEGTNVLLLPGLAAYRCTDASSDPEWLDGAEIISQLTLCDMLDATDGEIFFRYGSICGCPPLADYLRTVFTAEKPKSNAIFIKNEDFSVISPHTGNTAAEGFGLFVSVKAPADCTATALTTGEAVHLARGTDGLSGKASADNALTIVSDRGGCVGIQPVALKRTDASDPAALTHITSRRENGFTVITFRTERLCSARSFMKNGYLHLEVLPCRTGFLFECDGVSRVIVSYEDGVCRYCLKTENPVTSHFVREYDDRVELWFTDIF